MWGFIRDARSVRISGIDTKNFWIQQVKVERPLKRSLHESGLTRAARTKQEKALLRGLKKTVNCFHFESKKGVE